MTKRKYPDAPAYGRPHHPRVDFWSSFIPEPNSGCWLWDGSVTDKGYGVVNRGRQKGEERAHRWSWRIHYGPVPDGLHVLHKCDMPCCVNPQHLFLGTHNDNMCDMRRKGRLVNLHGEAHGNAKLTADAVREIRETRGIQTNAAVAARLGVSPSTVSMVRAGKVWRRI